MTRAELKNRGNAHIKEQYWSYVLASFLLYLVGGFGGGVTFDFSSEHSFWNIFMIVTAVLGMLISLALTIFITGPLEVGVRRFYLTGMYTKAPVHLIGSGFRKETYKKTVISVFLPKVFIFLWSLLLLIPGIIKAYEYYFVPWIVAEQPDLSPREAMKISRRITKGHKWELFVLELSFLGWLLVGAMCCGIGTIFVMPYVDATMTQMYDTLKVIQVD